MNQRDQLAQQLRTEMIRVRTMIAADPPADNYKLKHRERNAQHALMRAESALNLLDSTAMQLALDNLRTLI